MSKLKTLESNVVEYFAQNELEFLMSNNEIPRKTLDPLCMLCACRGTLLMWCFYLSVLISGSVYWSLCAIVKAVPPSSRCLTWFIMQGRLCVLVEQLGRDVPQFLWVTLYSRVRHKQTCTGPSHGTELNLRNCLANCSVGAYFISLCTKALVSCWPAFTNKSFDHSQ